MDMTTTIEIEDKKTEKKGIIGLIDYQMFFPSLREILSHSSSCSFWISSMLSSPRCLNLRWGLRYSETGLNSLGL